MGIHIGKKIKEEVYSQGIPIVSFAKKINRSRNVVYNIFERESIDTDLLNKIGKVLDCDFFSLYSAQKEYAGENTRTFFAENPIAYGKQYNELKALQKQNEALLTEISYLKKIVALMDVRKKKQK